MIGTDTQQLPAVRRGEARDLEQLISLMTAAFVRGGLSPHLTGDERVRGQVLRAYFRIVVPHALTYGQVHVIGNGQAAMIWYRHNKAGLPGILGYAARQAEAIGRPHHHLAYLAVLLAMHGEGLGIWWTEHYHRGLDNTGITAYLEATGPRGPLHRLSEAAPAPIARPSPAGSVQIRQAGGARAPPAGGRRPMSFQWHPART